MTTIDGQPLKLNRSYNMGNSKDSMKISVLKFYLSDIRVIDETGSTELIKAFHLFDNEDSISHEISFSTQDLNHPITLAFNLGIDSLTNSSGVYGGDLDPTTGMYWTWQSGYINFKLEGTSPICPARKNKFQYHIGGYQSPYNAMQKVSLTIYDSTNYTLELPLDQILGNLNLSSLYQIMSPKTEAVNMAKSISMQFKMGDGHY